MDVTSLATQERDEFANLLRGLTSEQWDTPSLCGSWRVREVAAHVIAYLDRGRVEFAKALTEHRLQLDLLNNADVCSYAAGSRAQIADVMREHAAPRGVGSGFGGRIALVECMIHQQDIRLPLGLPRVIPTERLRAALDFTKIAPLIRGGWYTRGVRLVATDLDWSSGRGPEVRGPGEALLMTMARRRSALTELDGPGVVALARRLEP
ncbi:hypothetical protein Y900_008495 [Mycolicibacterium aromaticivorans JS19b1 = JCM 16368]|uniref:Mycothiol-dependent maleylpyruvate isomerase metal-binding domain-containing protein n=2 Tax=Mycolicibacterium aromaticivorans TaxID=318425 RepID=A0A064CH40_9MYCO|nr:maleylpyruvate isomerase family mycothiol-dependent enzyme [Mycolicibacterium aromaticivorans]KDE98986.1 hypothetical protein Y900_008495 [Mycolicibacterium aromaticivorans JS19b1 = JCM 16368]